MLQWLTLSVDLVVWTDTPQRLGGDQERSLGDPRDVDVVPRQAPHTVWVTACSILVFSMRLCSSSPSPAMGDIHLAALFSWGDIRTVYFGFYRNSALLSHCTFICSSDNLKDQQRCLWSQWKLLSSGREKNSDFFFVCLFFLLLLLTSILWIWWTTKIVTINRG